MFTNIIIFIFGTCLGSFLNVVIYRLHSKEPIVNARSHCPYCKKNLRWFELIPLLSFIVQKGKCRNCDKKFSWQYIIMELITGLLLVSGWTMLNKLNLGDWQLFAYGAMWLYFISILIIIFVYDLKHYIIPDIVVYPSAIVIFLWNLFLFFFSDINLINYLLSAVVPATVFLSLIIASRGRWMGMGDVKFVFVLGLFLGFPKVLIMLFLAFTLGSIVGLILILFKGYNFKSALPFGTFLAFASIVALFYGDTIVDWYLKGNYLNLFFWFHKNDWQLSVYSRIFTTIDLI